jgi:hypothetical protein
MKAAAKMKASSAARYHRSGFDCLPRLRPACRRLVRRHRDKIERFRVHLSNIRKKIDKYNARVVIARVKRPTQYVVY